VLACSKPAVVETNPKPAPPPATMASTPSASARPSAAASVASAVAVLPPVEPVVARWNELHGQRDVQGLAQVYADTVEFYGEKLAKERVLALKKKAFEKAPDYTQSITGLKLTKPSPDRARAEFTKSWTQGGKTSSIAAVLELAGAPSGFKVTKETDGPSEVKRAQVAWSGCNGAAMNLLSHTDDVSDILKDKGMGLHMGSGPPDDPTFSIAVHQERASGWETLWWYDIDPKTGIAKNDMGQTLKVDPSWTQKLIDACKDELQR
jgi:hypothetical protein